MPDVSVNGVRIHFTSDGPVDPRSVGTILMMHGFARNGTFWEGWIPSLADRFTIIRPDMRGCGRSGDPGKPFNLADAVSDVFGLLDYSGVERVHYIGESTGGIVGVLAAARRPERFASLALVSTPLSPARGDTKAMAPQAESPVESLRFLGLRDWWLQSRRATGDVFGDERDEALADEFALTSLEVAVSMWQATHDPALTIEPYLADLRLPVLVMAPTESVTVSTADQDRLAAAIPGAQQIHYPGAPHFVWCLQPELLASDYRHFLSSLRSPESSVRPDLQPSGDGAPSAGRRPRDRTKA